MKTLRELAKDHAQGRLKKADYRKIRTDLIKGILAGEIEVKDHTFEAHPPPPKEDVTEQSSFDPLSTTKMATVPNFNGNDEDATLPDADHRPAPVKTEPAKETKTASHQNKLTLLFISTAVVLVIVIVLTFLVLRSGLETPPESNTTEKQSQQLNMPSATDKLISDFMTSNHWQTENLNKFIQDWQQLDNEDRQGALGSSRLNQLSSAIYKKILAEKALMSLGETESSAYDKQEELVDFAKSLGINDPKIRSQTE